MVTVRSAAVVDNCARASVWHLTYPFSETLANGTVLEKHALCSAFALAFAPARLGGSGATAVVTAAHCLGRLLPGSSATLKGVGGLPPLACTVAATFTAPDDAAILDCLGVAGLGGLELAPAGVHSLLRTPVGIAGFASDAYTAQSERHLPDQAVALNVDFAHISGVAGPLVDGTGSVCVTSGVPIGVSSGFSLPGVRPLGFVDRRVTYGMSGGPVLDLACGVVGIAHGRSCAAGAFTSLERVVAFLAARSA